MPASQASMCRHCGHAIGYHHLEGEKCSCKGCGCPGYKVNLSEANKLRADTLPSQEDARSFLAAQGIDPAEVTQATYSSDGSLFVLEGDIGHVVEFNPGLAVQLAQSLRAMGIRVMQRD